MEKIIILSFLFLTCVVLKSSAQSVNTTSVDMGPSITPNTTAPPMMTSVVGSTSTVAGPTPTPTSGAVNVKALAGFIASVALIALF